MLKTTANKITLVRIALIPVFLVIAYLDRPWIALAVFIIASLTELLDGYIARHCHQITNFGKFMDPLADKMPVIAAMCFFVEKGQMHGWALAIVLLREFAVSGLRLVAAEKSRVIAAVEEVLAHSAAHDVFVVRPRAGKPDDAVGGKRKQPAVVLEKDD